MSSFLATKLDARALPCLRQKTKDILARRHARTGYKFGTPRYLALRRENAAIKRENAAFLNIGEVLSRQEREMREERYVTRFYGIPSSWRAIERYALYFGIGANENLSTIVQKQFQEKSERSHPWSPLSFQNEPKTSAISASAHGAGASIAA